MSKARRCWKHVKAQREGTVCRADTLTGQKVARQCMHVILTFKPFPAAAECIIHSLPRVSSVEVTHWDD